MAIAVSSHVCAITSVIMSLPLMPEDVTWRDGEVAAVTWPAAAFNGPHCEIYIETGEILWHHHGIMYGFAGTIVDLRPEALPFP
jgi:hypothetical protein